MRHRKSLGLRDGGNGRNVVALEEPERESSTGGSYGHRPTKRAAESSCRGGVPVWGPACGLGFDANDPSFFSFCVVGVVFFAAALPPTVAWVAAFARLGDRSACTFDRMLVRYVRSMDELGLLALLMVLTGTCVCHDH